jgi:hypothetical protein
MMSVQELFRRLAFGELSNMAMAVDTNGTIKKSQQDRIIYFANEGLKNLHLRFILRERGLEITTSDAEQIIALDEDVIDVISILTAWGESLTFHTCVRPGEIYVSNRKLVIPAMNAAHDLQVNYHIRHPVLQPINVPADLDQNIKLAPELQPALTAYIASEMYRSLNSADSLAIASAYRGKYEALCNEAAARGVVSSDMQPMSKFDQRGFV